MSTMPNAIKDLLTSLGETMTLNKRAAGAYNVATAQATVTTTTHTVTAKFLNYQEREVDGTMIQRGDRKWVVAAQGLAVKPDVEDLVTISGTDYGRLVSVQTIKEGAAVIAYVCQVRV